MRALETIKTQRMVVYHMLISAYKEIDMTDFHADLAQMHRPRLLIQAARLGQQDYRRDRDLRRLGGVNARACDTVRHLIAQESAVEAARKAGQAGYSISHHVELLIALMAEIRLLPRTDMAP